MTPLIHAAITTTVVFLVTILTKQKLQSYVYLILFLLIAGTGYLFSSKIYASEIDWRNDHTYIFRQIIIETRDDRKEKDHSNKKTKNQFLKEKYKYHKECAKECYQNAKESCCLMPTLDHQEKANYCFRAGMALLTPATPPVRIFAAIMTFATEYGIDVMAEWNRIQNYLNRGMFHAEMMEFYNEILGFEKGEKDIK